VTASDRAALLEEMERALRAEFGALAIYRRLLRIVRDEELSRVLDTFCEDERDQLVALRALMSELGVVPRKGSLRRRIAAIVLALSVPVVGSRPVLRLCEEAEGTAARWYAHFRDFFLERGMPDRALTCDRLATTKLRHAQTLQTWVRNQTAR